MSDNQTMIFKIMLDNQRLMCYNHAHLYTNTIP